MWEAGQLIGTVEFASWRREMRRFNRYRIRIENTKDIESWNFRLPLSYLVRLIEKWLKPPGIKKRKKITVKNVSIPFPGIQIECSSGPVLVSSLSLPVLPTTWLVFSSSCTAWVPCVCSDFDPPNPPSPCNSLCYASGSPLPTPRLLGEFKFRHQLLYEGFLNSFHSLWFSEELKMPPWCIECRLKLTGEVWLGRAQ